MSNFTAVIAKSPKETWQSIDPSIALSALLCINMYDIIYNSTMKSINLQSDISIAKRALVLAIVYFLLFNSAMLLYKFSYYKAGNSLAFAELSKESLYILVMLFLSFLGFSINNILLKIYSIFLYSTGAFVSYYIYAMKILPTKQMVKAVFDVESLEAYELVSIRMILWVIISIVICIYLLRKFDTKDVANKFIKFLLFILFISSIANIITPFYRLFTSHLPINYLHNTYHYFLGRFDINERADISQNNSFASNTPDDLVVVLVIGESARYDHLSINGYKRNTTPRLSSIPNIHSYECEASSNMTYLSVSSLLSRLPATELEQSLNETSLLSIFTKLNFNTVWIGTQSLTKYFRDKSSSIYDEVNMAIIPGGSALYALSSYDEVMIPYLESALEKNTKSLIVLHPTGSHWNYAARYPKNFAYFTPGCEELSGKVDHSACGYERLINSYDNSILYTDHVLGEIIEKLKHKNAFLIYVSDHAESLGENGFYGHGSNEIPTEQKIVPLIAWFSDKYLANNPDFRYISERRILSHDNIFHSILDCANIQSHIIDKHLSICTKPVA
jgi:glucan phosphoethanolaminetransferase (alkaline phosphatase superfamily)